MQTYKNILTKKKLQVTSCKVWSFLDQFTEVRIGVIKKLSQGRIKLFLKRLFYMKVYKIALQKNINISLGIISDGNHLQ